jgi:hypothetical protein
MALNTILEKLHEEQKRLTEELDRVVRMIKAAGKGAEAAWQEYGRRTSAQRRAKAGTGASKRKKVSAASRNKMAEAQRARRARERSGATAKKAPRARPAKSRTAKAPAPIL